MKNLILSLLCLVAFTSAAQLTPGTYFISNKGRNVKVVIDNMDSVRDFEINYNDTLIMHGTGFWFQVNVNAMEEGYDGPDGWYEIELDNMEIDEYIELNVNYITNNLELKDPFTEELYELKLKTTN